MRIRMSKSKVWSGIVVCAAVLGIMRLGRVSAETNVNICHFQQKTAIWQFLSLPQSSVIAHLRNHDDAIPGGTTAQTGTVLDGSCVKVPVTCPCAAEGTAVELHELFLAQPFDGTPMTSQCTFGGPTGWRVFRNDSVWDESGNLPPYLAVVVDTLQDGSQRCLYHLVDSNQTFIVDVSLSPITEEEMVACRADIELLAAQLTDCP